MLGLFFGVEVVEIAEELIETVHRRQMLVTIAEMVLAELTGAITLVLHGAGDGRIDRHHAFLGARQADLGQAGAQPALAHDEASPAGSAALFGVVIGEQHPFPGDAIDVGRVVAHHPVRIATEV